MLDGGSCQSTATQTAAIAIAATGAELSLRALHCVRIGAIGSAMLKMELQRGF